MPVGWWKMILAQQKIEEKRKQQERNAHNYRYPTVDWTTRNR